VANQISATEQISVKKLKISVSKYIGRSLHHTGKNCCCESSSGRENRWIFARFQTKVNLSLRTSLAS